MLQEFGQVMLDQLKNVYFPQSQFPNISYYSFVQPQIAKRGYPHILVELVRSIEDMLTTSSPKIEAFYCIHFVARSPGRGIDYSTAAAQVQLTMQLADS